jgi:hypothetical protein
VTATVTWRTPSADGGSRVTGYQVRALRIGPHGKVVSVRTSSRLGARVRARTMPLERGVYRFQVRAINAVGNSPWSSRSKAVRAR